MTASRAEEQSGRTTHLPFDLVVVAAATLVADALVLSSPGFNGNRTPPVLELPVTDVTVMAVELSSPAVASAFFGLLLLFFLPGYASLAALFPHRHNPTTTGAVRQERAKRRMNLGTVERVALSFGMSLAFLALLGLGIALSPWTYSLATLIVVLTGAIFVCIAIGTVRGHRTLLERPTTWRARIAGYIAAHRGQDRIVTAVNVALTASVLLALGSLSYALIVPVSGETYTEFYLLTPDEAGGGVAAAYSAEATWSSDTPFILAIENQEGEPMRYTVVTDLERVQLGTSSVRVVQNQEVSRLQTTVQPGETQTLRPALPQEPVEDSTRFAFYLYVGEAPANAGPQTAYRRLYVWLDRERPAGALSET